MSRAPETVHALIERRLAAVRDSKPSYEATEPGQRVWTAAFNVARKQGAHWMTGDARPYDYANAIELVFWALVDIFEKRAGRCAR